MAETKPLDNDVSPSEMPTRDRVATGLETPGLMAFVPDQVIAGRYTLLEPLGEGGMGEVWIARQDEPIKRKVAIKLIKIGSDSKGIIARFEQERQALAVLDHPNIARVYDGGLTSDQPGSTQNKASPRGQAGRPFFVMELVHGQPLIKFCDTQKLSVNDRLALFVPICRAVQHAHQKGIIHRDLKPANILVTMVDGKPVPKVIDFGVAKPMGGKLIEDTLSTALGALVGTLEYMSPEQAGLSTEDIDTRADIYALGVVLYELLTGLRPFDSKRLRQAALDEMLRIIKEEEPPSLASRLSTDESLASMAALRKCEPARLISLVQGELDWIVHKCLEKDRNHRYETANGLARDIERYLADEPLEARPASPGYRLHKFYRRHRGVVWASGLVACSLMGGTVAALWGLSRALDAEKDARTQASIAEEEKAKALSERDQKEAARAEEARQRKLAQESEKRSLLEMNRTRAVSQFLQMDLLALASVETQLDEQALHFGRDVKVRDLLDRAASRVKERFQDQPELEAEIRATIGITYRKLGEMALAEEHLLRALKLCEKSQGPDDPSTIRVRNSLAVNYDQMGKVEQSIALHEANDRSLQKSWITNPKELLNYQSNRALSYFHGGREAEALVLMEQTVKACREKLGIKDDQTLTSSISYGSALARQGQASKAVPLLVETVEACKSTKGEHHPTTLIAQFNLAQCYLQTGKTRKAQQILEPLRPAFESILGPEHPNTLTSLSTLAKCYEDQQRYQESEKLFRQVWKIHQERIGKDDLKTLTVENNLAVVLSKTGKNDEALKLYEHVYQQRSKKLGEEHPEVLITLNNWAGSLDEAGHIDRALAMYQDCYRRYLKKQGPDHPNTIRMAGNLAGAFARTGKLDDARKYYEQARADSVRVLGADHPDAFYDGHFLAEFYRRIGLHDKSAALYAEVLPFFKKQLGDDHVDTICTVNNLAVVESELKRYPEAIEHLRWVIQQRTKHLGANHANTLAASVTLSSIYRLAERYEDSHALSRQILPALEKKYGVDHNTVIRVMNNLGLSLFKLKRFDQAVPVFDELYQRQSRKLGTDHAETIFTLANLGSNQFSAGQKEQGIASLEAAYLKGKEGSEADFIRQSLLTCYRQTQQTAKTEPLLRDAVQAQKKQYGASDLRTVRALETHAHCLSTLRRWSEATQIWQECFTIQQKIDAPWRVAVTQVKLGLALLEDKKPAEGERHLLQGCQALQPLLRDANQEETVRKVFNEGAQALAKHFQSSGKISEADQWKKLVQGTEK